MAVPFDTIKETCVTSIFPKTAVGLAMAFLRCDLLDISLKSNLLISFWRTPSHICTPLSSVHKHYYDPSTIFLSV